MRACWWNENADELRNSFFAPALVVAAWNARRLWNEHWEHWDHMPPLEERVEYPYQNIRVKNYPWGNGDKVRLFPHFNNKNDMLTR